MSTSYGNREKILSLSSGVVALALLLIFSVELYYIFAIHVWRHDSILNFSNYYGIFISEGRWLIYLIFTVLRQFPPHLSLVLSFVALFFFSWSCSRPLTDRRIALIFSLATLQIPAIYSLIGWPVIPLPSYLLLAAAAFLSRRLDYRSFFLLFGILFHGAFNNFYNLLPALYIVQIYRGKIKLHTLIAYYVIGFIVGYIVAQFTILYVHGTFMQIAEWRGSRYIDSINTTIRNFNRVIQSIKNNIIFLPAIKLVICTLIACVIIPYIQRFPSFLSDEQKKGENLAYIWQSQLLLLIIACSPYAQSFPLGLSVAIRTAIPLYFSLLCFPLVISNKHRLISCFAILALAVSFAVPNINTLRYYQGVTSTYLEELKSITPHPERYKILFLPGQKDLMTIENRLVSLHNYKNSTNEWFAEPKRWPPVARAAHFPTVLYGDDAKHVMEKLGTVTFTSGKLYDHALVGDYLILKFNENFGKKH